MVPALETVRSELEKDIPKWMRPRMEFCIKCIIHLCITISKIEIKLLKIDTNFII